MEHKYTLKNALRDFSLDELTEGFENALATPFEVISQTDEYDDGEEYTLIEPVGVMSIDGEFGFDPYILVQDDFQELVELGCGCARFREDTYTCVHVQSLLASYLIKRDGVDSFKGTVIEENLKNKTGVDTPFIPGVLRKSDSRISPLLINKRTGGTNQKEIPVWLTPKEGSTIKGTQVNITVECKLHSRGESRRMSVELKAGPKKVYVIRHMDKLLACYEKSDSYQFSSSVCIPAGRIKYNADAKPIMDFLSQIHQDYSRRKWDNMMFMANGNERREAWLDGSDLDEFMELIEGKRISIEDYYGDVHECTINFEQKPDAVKLTKEEYGATFKAPREVLLGHGKKWMYLIQNDKLLRMDVSAWDDRRALSEVTRLGQELYVQNKDLPSLCKNIVSIFGDRELIETDGINLDSYLPKKPDIRIYLDYPQNHMISCKLKSYYEATDQEYTIFDQQKDKTKRNLEFEQSAVAPVWPYFQAYDETNMELVLECEESELYSFLVNTIPELYNYGEVFISDALKRLKVRSAGDFTIGIQVDAGSLTMSLKSNALSKSEMIEILSSYNRKKNFTRLKNGDFIKFDQEKMAMFEAIVEQYRNYGKKDPEAFKVPLFRAIYLDEALKNRDEFSLEVNDEYKDLICQISNNDDRNYEVPKKLAKILRNYQIDGYRWLKMLKRNGFGGILADDMGLGKTLQVLTFIMSEYEDGKRDGDIRTLIVAPASLIYNWQYEIEKYTPQIKCIVIAGTVAERREIIASIGTKKTANNVIYITSYDLLKRDLDAYEGKSFANQIIDEAQFVKNQNTNVAKSVRLIESGFRVALTGTPIENRLSDLWSIFDYLMPGFLYSYARFREDYESAIVNNQDEETMARLRMMVHPFILRRLKKDVLKDLPDKTEEIVNVRLEGEQRKLYDAYAERLRLYLDKQTDEDFNQSKIEILAELTKLRQICCGPELIIDKYTGENVKLVACTELVRQAIEGEHKVLIFSQFTSVLDEIGKALKKNKIKYHRIDGSVSKENRMKLVTEFEHDDVPVFCISLKAGGTGLNLTAADIVIHYDPWWNIAAQNQATDRTHRIGQTNNVTVYQLVAENTIEEQIVKLQKAKEKLAEDILSGEGIASIMINKDELLKLL